MNNDPENTARIQAMIAKKTGTIPAGPLHRDVRDALGTAPLLPTTTMPARKEPLRSATTLTGGAW